MSQFNRYKARITEANPKARFWDYKINRKRCLIVHGEPIALQPTSYSLCTANRDYDVEGDLVVYPQVEEPMTKDLEKRGCPVVGVHEHIGMRHLHIKCRADEKKLDKIVDYLRWF